MKSFVFLIFTALLFVGCGDSTNDNEYIEGDMKPSLSNVMLYNFDENITQSNNKQIGKVFINDEGGSKITDYEIEGSGSSLFYVKDNFFYLKDGISSLDCKNNYLYNLTLRAQNNYGKSNFSKLYMQVNCLENPSLDDIYIDFSDPSNNRFDINFKRKGSSGSDTIQSIGLYDAENFSYLGTYYNDIELKKEYDGWKIIIHCYGSRDTEKMHYLLRAVNDKDLKSPFVNLEIYRHKMECSDYSYNNDDYPNDVNDPNVPTFSGDNFGFGGNIDYNGDIDAFRFNVATTGVIGSFSVSTSDSIDITVNQSYTYTTNSQSIPVEIKQPDNTLSVSAYNQNVNYYLSYNAKTDNEDGYLLNVQNYTYYGAIDFGGDSDTVYINAPSSGQIIIEAIDSADSFNATLYDSNGNNLGSQSGSYINLPINNAGSYYITIDSPIDIGVYSLTLTP